MWLIVTHKRRFRDSQIVVITNFVVVLSVGVKRAVCNGHSYYLFLWRNDSKVLRYPPFLQLYKPFHLHHMIYAQRGRFKVIEHIQTETDAEQRLQEIMTKFLHIIYTHVLILCFSLYIMWKRGNTLQICHLNENSITHDQDKRAFESADLDHPAHARKVSSGPMFSIRVVCSIKGRC